MNIEFKYKIYISGPITGVPDYKERFQKVEDMYKAQGIYVINPAKMNDVVPEDGTTWEQYMDIDIMLLKLCNAVHMLPGWQQSKGACIEYYIARERDMVILEE